MPHEMRRLSVIPLIAGLAFLAAGCGDGRPTSFVSCGESGGHGLDTIYPRTFDCLAGGYQHDCRPTQASVTDSGVDSAVDYRLRIYRRGNRCAGDVRADNWVMGQHTTTERADCRIAYAYVIHNRRTLTFFQCGDVGDITLHRGRACVIRYPPKICRALRISRRSPHMKCRVVLGTRQHPWGC
jgi:hypothetical protein